VKRLLLIALILLMVAPALAQTATPTPTPSQTPLPTSGATRTPRPTSIPGECGQGLPCGPLPWRLPSWPNLQSPTPFPTVLIEQTLTATYTPGGPTVTPTPTMTPSITPTLAPTGTYQFEEIEQRLQTLQAVLEATAPPVLVEGTAVDLPTQIDGFASSGLVVFGLFRGLGEIYWGPFAPIVVLVISSMGVVLTVKITRLVFPVVMAVFNFIRRVVQFVLDLIPG